MKVAGFTFIRNAIRYDFPVAEAIRSVLPLCDAFFVASGDSEDDSEALLRELCPNKIRIIHTVWNTGQSRGGSVYAEETNKAFDAIPSGYDWCFYIQGDEVVHEKDIPVIEQAMQLNLNDPGVEGLVFRYLHFYGTFDYVADSRKWYRREVRIIRNDKTIRSYRDAQGFRRNGRKLKARLVDAAVYHYGWVRHPRYMNDKIVEVRQFYERAHGDKKVQDFNYSLSYDSLKKFTGSHPAVMKERIERLNWKVEIDTGRRNLKWKYRLLYWFERITGIRPFEFRNYRLLKS